MKKHLLAAVICVMTAISPLFGQQHVQSLSFSGPSTIDIRSTTTTFTLSVDLAFSGYSAAALDYWLEVQNALAPFLTVTDVTCFTLPCPPPGPTPYLLAQIQGRIRVTGASLTTLAGRSPS